MVDFNRVFNMENDKMNCVYRGEIVHLYRGPRDRLEIVRTVNGTYQTIISQPGRPPAVALSGGKLRDHVWVFTNYIKEVADVTD